MTAEQMKAAADAAQAKADELWKAFKAHEQKYAAVFAEQDRLRYDWYHETQQARYYGLMLKEMETKQ